MACNVWMDHANATEVPAHQITPLKRLRAGKEEACQMLVLGGPVTLYAVTSPAVHQGLEAIDTRSVALPTYIPE